MTDGIKISFRWNGEEGKPSASDLRKLEEMGGIAVMDFLRDVAFEAEEIYLRALRGKWLWKDAE